MFGIENFSAFALAATIVVITPGNDTLMVLTRSITHGRAIGVYSAIGVSLGLLVHASAAALGLSVILANSAAAFNVIKYLGAAYLIYLGYKALTAKVQQTSLTQTKATNAGRKKMFLTALLSNILNPKIAIFFLAFLPQFISRNEINNPIPYLLLGFVIFLITICWCTFLALMGGRVALFFNRFQNAEKWMNKTSGMVFILLGLKVALTKK